MLEIENLHVRVQAKDILKGLSVKELLAKYGRL